MISKDDGAECFVAEELYHHVPCYTEFAKVRLANDACERFLKSLVAQVARELRVQPCLAVSSGDGVNNSFESGVCCSEGCEFPQEYLKGGWSMGRMLSRALFVMTHVITVFQFRQALRRVACAVPRGPRTSAKALLLAATPGWTL